MDFLFILLYGMLVFVVACIAIVLFQRTGLQKEVAYNVVITTLIGRSLNKIEPVHIMRHPIRRWISMSLMLFGYFSWAVTIAALFSLFSNHFPINVSITVVALLIALVWILRNRRIMGTIIFQEKNFGNKVSNQLGMKSPSAKKGLALLRIKANSPFIGCLLNEVFPVHGEIKVLLIKRESTVVKEISSSEQLKLGDELIITGTEKALQEEFKGMLEEYIETPGNQ